MRESIDTFSTRGVMRVGERRFEIFRLQALEFAGFDVGRLPYCLRILLENLLRHEDGVSVTEANIRALGAWQGRAGNGSHAPPAEIAFMPARVLTQDLTGVPAVVDLAAMRDAVGELGGHPSRVNPSIPVELVIDHSVQVDAYGAPEALQVNRTLDYERNAERYALLRWAQQAFANFRVVPPGGGICHQVNLEHLARVVFTSDELPSERSRRLAVAYPDTVVGMDSHTPMVNGLGVLAWGVGGIEAEAAMLGQQIGMLVPEVLGLRLEGELQEGTTATDLVLTIAQLLRRHGVVGKFVEFYGPGLASVPLADRATIGNMSPEYGATCAIFPVDHVTLAYLRLTGRSAERVALVEAYMKEQGLFRGPDALDPVFSETLQLDLGQVEPSIAGPGRPQDRVPLSRAGQVFGEALKTLVPPPASAKASRGSSARLSAARATDEPDPGQLDHGAVVIAAITSCTNTSNPQVMLAAGLLARNAVRRRLTVKPWVKTSLAPGSRVVTDYLRRAGLLPSLEQLGFSVVGYGCTTCIGNSGPLPETVSREIRERNLVACAVLSGNRNFEGRIHAEVRANYLMSPPLVVAYALAGTMTWNPDDEPVGEDANGAPVWLRDIWPAQAEIAACALSAVESDMFRRSYDAIYDGDDAWRALPVPGGEVFHWDPASTYVKRPVFLERVPAAGPQRIAEIAGARVLVKLGDSITTDHISPAGSIKPDSPAGRYLLERGVRARDFNSYGARRGNHEVMVRGTFANPRLRNLLLNETEGGWTVHLPSGETMSIHDAAGRYAAEGIPLIVLAGREYGSGSSRDWAAKGPLLQGVRAVLAESFERIHRSNLVGMGILPLQFLSGESAGTLRLDGRERFYFEQIDRLTGPAFVDARVLCARVERDDGTTTTFEVLVRIDTPQEAAYFREGGILPYVLRRLARGDSVREPLLPGPLPAAPQQPAPSSVPQDKVEESSRESFPASDPPAY